MKNLLSISSRFGSVFSGLMFTAIPSVFVIFGIAMTVISAHHAATYQPVEATVDKVSGADEASDRVTIEYSFLVNGRKFTGEESANEDAKDRFEALRKYQVGQKLTVYYNPKNPSKSQVSVKPDAFGLVFVIFAMPFMAIGLSQLWLGLTGREIIRMRRPNAQSDAVPGGSMFWIFTLTCVAGAVGQVALSLTAPWPWSLIGGLVILFAAIPAANIWANRLVKRLRTAKAAKLREVAAARRAARNVSNPAIKEHLEGEAFLLQHSLGKKMAFLLTFTIFWCGITSVFVVLVVGSLVKHHYAAVQFASTEGVVLLSKIKTSSGQDGTTCSPNIKYRYTVAGREYVCDRYDYLCMSSSDATYALQAVKENPPGKKITVYYNPDDPAEAILHLEVPGSSYFLLLFLQPFILVGLVMICACVYTPFAHRKTKRFFQNDSSPPWHIPGWGVMKESFDGLVIQKQRGLLLPFGAFFAGYGLACFLSIFVVGFLFNGFGDTNIEAVRWAFIVAGCVGAAAMLVTFVKSGGGSRVTIDRINRRLAVHSRRRDLSTKLREISGLRVRPISYPAGVAVNGRSVRYLLLEAALESDQTMPIHAFKPQSNEEETSLAVAERTRLLLCGLIGCPTEEPDYKEEETAQSETPTNPAQAVGTLLKMFQRRGEGYGDLS